MFNLLKSLGQEHYYRDGDEEYYSSSVSATSSSMSSTSTDMPPVKKPKVEEPKVEEEFFKEDEFNVWYHQQQMEIHKKINIKS